MDLLPILLMLLVLYVLAVTGSTIFERFGVPGLIGQILVGIIVANIIWDGSAFEGILSEGSLLGIIGVELPVNGSSGSESYQFLKIIAEIGAIFLLFSVGLETRACDLKSVGKPALVVAILGVVFPFLLGLTLFFYDGNMVHAMYMAAAMVATSVGVTAKVLVDLRKTNTKEARIILGAAVIDDVLGMIVLAMIAGTGAAGGFGEIIGVIMITVVFVLSVFVFCDKCVPRLDGWYCDRCESKPSTKSKFQMDKLMLAIGLCLFMSFISQAIGLAAIIGAFLAGMMLADYAHSWDLKPKVDAITTFFLPLFFLNVGMHVQASSLMSSTVLLLSLYVIIVAIVTKYLGCYVGARISDKTIEKDSAKIIGIGMVPRAEVGIIIAAIGFTGGFLTSEMNTVIILMSVVTTVIAPPLLKRAFRKKYPEDSPEGSCST